MFDIGSLKAKDTSIMHLTDPATGKTAPGVEFEVYSKDSDVFRAAKLKIDRQRAKKWQGHRKMTLDPAEIEQENLELVAACIVGWKGLSFGGKKFEYSKENAVKLMQDFPEIYEQVDLFVGDRSNFLPSA
jgi:hypothetical protein